MSRLYEIETFLDQYLETITDKYLKDKEPPHMPVVGMNQNLLKLILEVNKGFYVIEAHTGAGKTTLGLSLYHMSKARKIPHKVTYINLRLLRETEGDIDDIQLINKLYEIISKPNSYMNESKYQDVIRTTLNKDYEEKRIEDLLNKLTNENIRYIVILDEVERGLRDMTSINNFADWAKILRDHFDRKGVVPLKVVLLLAKIRGYKEIIMRGIKNRGDHVKVFSEIRTLSISYPILNNYLEKLDTHFKNQGLKYSIKDNIIDKNSIDKLIKYLELMENGRYIFPKLRTAIRDAIVKFLKDNNVNQSISEISDLLNILNSLLSKRTKKHVHIEVNKYIDRVTQSIISGRYYGGGLPRRDVIEMWREGLKKTLEYSYENVGLISSELNFIIYQIGKDSFVWLSFKKYITVNDYDRALSKIARILGTGISGRKSSRTVKVILLKPAISRAYYERERIYQGITFKFSYIDLERQELISIAALNERITICVELAIAEQIARELASRIEAKEFE